MGDDTCNPAQREKPRHSEPRECHRCHRTLVIDEPAILLLGRMFCVTCYADVRGPDAANVKAATAPRTATQKRQKQKRQKQKRQKQKTSTPPLSATEIAQQLDEHDHQWKQLRDHMGLDGSDLEQIAAAWDRMKAIVDKLPKTADGVVVMPGDTLWYPQFSKIHAVRVVSINDYDEAWPATIRADFHNDGTPHEYRWHVQGCYSTREAAEAAKENPNA